LVLINTLFGSIVFFLFLGGGGGEVHNCTAYRQFCWLWPHENIINSQLREIQALFIVYSRRLSQYQLIPPPLFLIRINVHFKFSFCQGVNTGIFFLQKTLYVCVCVRRRVKWLHKRDSVHLSACLISKTAILNEIRLNLILIFFHSRI